MKTLSDIFFRIGLGALCMVIISSPAWIAYIFGDNPNKAMARVMIGLLSLFMLYAFGSAIKLMADIRSKRGKG